MKAVVYNEDLAKLAEQAVMKSFGCSLYDLVGFVDTEGKKTMVFVLHKFYEFDKKHIGKAYWMTWPYVPTVADEMTERFLGDAVYREKVTAVLIELGYKNELKVA